MEIEKKVCIKCNQEKNLFEMAIQKRSTHSIMYRNVCLDCRNEQTKLWKLKHPEACKNFQNKEKEKKKDESYQKKISDRAIEIRRDFPERTLLYAAKQRAKEKGFEFNLEMSDIIIPKVCPILKIKLYYCNCCKNTPTLDRVDNEKGYVKGNIRVISYLANTMKNNATYEELMLFAKNIKAYLNKKI